MTYLKSSIRNSPLFFFLEMGDRVFAKDQTRDRMGSKELPEDNFEEELRRIVAGKKNEARVMESAKNVKECLESSDIGDVFLKLSSALNVASVIAPFTPLSQLVNTFHVLSKVFQKIGDTFHSHANSTELDKTYTELQRHQDTEVRSDAIGLENALFNKNAYLNELNEHTSKNTINDLENNIPVDRIVTFLGKLQGKIQELIQSQSVSLARRATVYINLYFRLSILHKLILWRVFCVKRKCGYDQTSTRGVLAMITESQRTDTEMLFTVCDANVQRFLFLTVFHPTEIEYFLNFLRIYKYKIPSIGQEEDFNSKTHAIRFKKSPEVKLEMSSWYGGRILATRRNSDACKFKFEPVKGRNLDNIFYLKSMHWSEYYVFMGNDGTCQSVKKQPNTEGQWKLVRLENELGPPQYVISTLKWPGRFLYLESILGIESIKSTNDPKKAMARGLWEILDL